MKNKIEWGRKWIMGLRHGTNNKLLLNYYNMAFVSINCLDNL